jgi:hypothetical protein
VSYLVVEKGKSRLHRKLRLTGLRTFAIPVQEGITVQMCHDPGGTLGDSITPFDVGPCLDTGLSEDFAPLPSDRIFLDFTCMDSPVCHFMPMETVHQESLKSGCILVVD